MATRAAVVCSRRGISQRSAKLRFGRSAHRLSAAAVPADRTDLAAEEEVGRAALLRSLSSACAAAAGSAPLLLSPPAFAKSVDEATKELKTYGVPEIAPKDLPFGWNAVVEPIGLADSAYYGRFKLGNEPLVVTFVVPPGWVVAKPNIDFNGTAGTVSANDFSKGDSATLFVETKYEKTLDTMKKGDYYKAMRKALTQKGGAFIEGLKITKVMDGSGPEYKVIEYDYEIESGAGFSINRSGFATVAQVGDEKNLQLFWTGTTQPRWGAMKDNLLQIVKSFKVAKLPKEIAEAATGVYAEKFNNEDAAMARGKLY